MIKLTIDKILTELNISRYELSKRTGITYPVINNYYKNKVIRYDSYVLDKICTALDCDISEIIEFKNDSSLDFVKVYDKLELNGTKEAREEFLKSLNNDELDILINQPSTVQRKIYLSSFKTK